MAVVAAEAVASLVMMNCHGEFGRLRRSRLYGHAYQGIQDGLTGYLDQDVIPANLDFDAGPQGQYLTSFGSWRNTTQVFGAVPAIPRSYEKSPTIQTYGFRSATWGGAFGGLWTVTRRH